MRMHHTPSHWILVAVVLAALLLTLREAHGQSPAGQSPGAAAVFEGRPAMAGAQGGLGAQAGPPQGGIGVQGPEAAERSIHLRRPSGTTEMPQGAPAAARTDIAAGEIPDSAAPVDRSVKPRDRGYARENRSVVRKTKRAAKRTIRRARTGTSEIDAH